MASKALAPSRSTQYPLAPRPALYDGGMFQAPVKGLDIRDSLFGQDPRTAIIAKNVLCRRYGVELRRGFRRWLTNVPGEVRSLMSYFPPRGAGGAFLPRLWAAATDGNIYDSSAPQNEAFVPPVALALPGQVQPGVFSWTMFSAGGTNFLVVCGAGIGVWTFDHAGGWINRTGAINGTGGAVTNFDFVMTWMNRLWFLALNSNIAWYLPVASIAGAAQSFDFGPLLVFGGDLAAMGSWTLDAGDGIDDKLVIVGRGGDVLVYECTDPSQATQFRVIGRWAVGRVPVGRRFMSKYGGDLSIINGNGVELMSQLASARGLLVPGGELGGSEDWIRYMEVIAKDVRQTFQSQFWRTVHFPGEQCMIILTPHNRVQDSLQYCFGTLSGGWTEFAGVPMLSIEVHDGEVYFGTLDGKVMQMFFGNSDDLLSDGTPGRTVIADVQTAFVAMNNDPFHTKRPLMCMPMFLAPSPPSVKAQINTEWSQQPVPGSPVYNPSALAKWDTAKWDQAKWGGSGNFFNAWIGAEGLGTHASLRMTFAGGEGTIFTSWKLASEIGKGML
jgi:hypothetical protein